MIKTQTIILTDDTIELMHNDMLSSRPYLLRLTGWNNFYDLRLSSEDLANLADSIKFFIKDDTNS